MCHPCSVACSCGARTAWSSAFAVHMCLSVGSVAAAVIAGIALARLLAARVSSMQWSACDVSADVICGTVSVGPAGGMSGLDAKHTLRPMGSQRSRPGWFVGKPCFALALLEQCPVFRCAGRLSGNRLLGNAMDSVQWTCRVSQCMCCTLCTGGRIHGPTGTDSQRTLNIWHCGAS